MVDPTLDTTSEIVEFRKDCAEHPSDSRFTTIRAAGPPSMHEQRAHKRDRRIVERVVAGKETFEATLDAIQTLPGGEACSRNEILVIKACPFHHRAVDRRAK